MNGQSLFLIVCMVMVCLRVSSTVMPRSGELRFCMRVVDWIVSVSGIGLCGKNTE